MILMPENRKLSFTIRNLCGRILHSHETLLTNPDKAAFAVCVGANYLDVILLLSSQATFNNFKPKIPSTGVF